MSAFEDRRTFLTGLTKKELINKLLQRREILSNSKNNKLKKGNKVSQGAGKSKRP